MVTFSIDILDNQDNLFAHAELPSDSSKFRIGRGKGKNYQNNIQLPASLTRVSRDHCSLMVVNDVCFLVDEGSAMGIMVNGEKRDGIQRIEPEDSIVLPGEWSIKLRKSTVEIGTNGGGKITEITSNLAGIPLQVQVGKGQEIKGIWDGVPFAKELYSQESIDLMLRLHNNILDYMNRSNIREIDKHNPEHIDLLDQYLFELVEKNSHLIPHGIPADTFRLTLRNEVLEHGPITVLLHNPQITEIMVNGPDKVFIEMGGALYKTYVKFFNEERLIAMIRGIVEPLGRRIDASSPMVDARLEDGSRVNAIIPPLALDGASVTIRKFSKKKLTTEDLIKFGSMNQKMAKFLQLAVEKRLNIVVSGGTGSGKTTLLNVLSDFIPADQRVVTIEDSAELKLNQDNIVRLESRPANAEGTGRVTIQDLVINALRMRPDRIVVGECRGKEALDMLQAMNTGHDGSLTTLHANNSKDALSRLVNMVMMAGHELPVKVIREQIASAVNLIVQQSRLVGHERKIVSITEITGIEEDTILTQNIFEFVQTGLEPGKDGKMKAVGFFTPTGNIPKFISSMLDAGESVDMDMFVPEN